MIDVGTQRPSSVPFSLQQLGKRTMGLVGPGSHDRLQAPVLVPSMGLKHGTQLLVGLAGRLRELARLRGDLRDDDVQAAALGAVERRAGRRDEVAAGLDEDVGDAVAAGARGELGRERGGTSADCRQCAPPSVPHAGSVLGIEHGRARVRASRGRRRRRRRTRPPPLEDPLPAAGVVRSTGSAARTRTRPRADWSAGWCRARRAPSPRTSPA